jgi:hypothetical protein
VIFAVVIMPEVGLVIRQALLLLQPFKRHPEEQLSKSAFASCTGTCSWSTAVWSGVQAAHAVACGVMLILARASEHVALH